MTAIGGYCCVYVIDHSIYNVGTEVWRSDRCCVRSIEILMVMCYMLKSEASY